MLLIPFILATSAIGSAFVDNVIFVAAFCPVIEQLSVSVKAFPLWWALLFGACIGGNITMIGSTANIVALGMLEKKAPHQMGFFAWLKVGALSALLAGGVVWIGLVHFAVHAGPGFAGGVRTACRELRRQGGRNLRRVRRSRDGAG